MIRYIYIILILMNLILADDVVDNKIYYFPSGASLVSFNTLPDDATINNIFSPIEDKIIAIITSGEISYNGSDANANNSWVGNLTELNNNSGYWVITSDATLINIEGMTNQSNGYYLLPGSNLISYPFENTQTLEEALPFYIYDNLSAIIGQDEAALINNNQVFGSLTHFEPNKGYWFLTTGILPFAYNNPIEGNSSWHGNNINTLEEEANNSYSQSTLQSVFFIEKAFYNGMEITNNDKLVVNCNNTIVGEKNWFGEMTDLIAMGNDGFGTTENYCEELQNISISINKDDTLEDMHIVGNSEWESNNISIISISNIELGDINLNGTINVTDIVIMIDHIIDNNLITNSHQLFLSDINTDGNINITDIVFILDSIIE